MITSCIPRLSMQTAAAGNVHDGVNGAYFMKMHFFQRLSVYLALGFRYDLKDFQRQLKGMGRKASLGENAPDVREIPSVGMGMRLVRMVMFRLLVAGMAGRFTVMARAVQVSHVMVVVFVPFIQNHMEIAGFQAGFRDRSYFCPVALQRKAFQRLQQNVSVGPQIQQGAHGHIAADAAGAVQI